MYGKPKAFSLVEVILTVAIIGVLASVLLPRFIKAGFIEGLTLRKATSQISSDIRYTRQLAITNAIRHIIRFDFARREYRIYQDSVSSTNQVGETKTVPPNTSCSGTSQFDFYPLGNAVSSGTGLNLTLDTHQYRITVEPPSGAVVVEKIS